MNNIINDEIFEAVQSMLCNYGLDHADDGDYIVYRDKLKFIRNTIIPPMPLKLEPFSIMLKAGDSPSDAMDRAGNLRNVILQIMEMEVEVVRSMINDASQIKKTARNKIIELYDASSKALEDLIVNLMRRLLVNYQPGIKRLIEYLLLIFILKTEPLIMADIADDDEKSFPAMYNLIGQKIDSAFRNIFIRYLCDDMKEKIEKDLGISMDPICPDGVVPFDWIGMMKDESEFVYELLIVKNFLHELIGCEYSFEEGEEIVIQVFPAKGDRPLACFPGLYRGYNVLLQCSGLVNVFYASAIGNGTGDRTLKKVSIKDGLFHADGDIDQQSECTVASLLNNILRLDETAIKVMRKTIRYLVYLHDDLFTPTVSRAETAKMIASVIRIKGKVRLDFHPSKDESMYFRARAGKDCSINHDFHVIHPRSCFYKILMFGKWIGYVTLLDVRDQYDRKAILIDVFNMRQDPHVDFTEIYEKFIDELASQIKPQGYEYILIPSKKELLSNHELIREPIFWRYENSKKIDGFSLEPVEKTFQTTEEGMFLVVRDLSDCWQLEIFIND